MGAKSRQRIAGRALLGARLGLCVLIFMAAQSAPTAASAEPLPQVSGGTMAAPSDLAEVLSELPSFRALDAQREDVRLQIFITEVPNAEDVSTWRSAGYRVGEEYLYPASAIKHLAAMAVFARHPELRPQDLVSIYEAPSPALTPEELASFQGRRARQQTLEEIVRDALITSGNDAYNRLVDIVGHQALNEWLRDAGLVTSKLRHRMFAFAPNAVQRMSPRVEVRRDGRVLLRLPARRSAFEFSALVPARAMVGDAYIDEDSGARVDRAMDFSEKNDVPIADLHRAMMMFAFPAASAEALGLPVGARGLGLSAQARAFLIAVMSEHPQGRADRGFEVRADRYKPLLPGLRRVLPVERIDYVNKAGRAYGFHVESAWLRDRVTGRALVVTAGLYVNSDGVVNDNRYDYHRSYAFFADLGEWVGQRLLEAR